MHDFLNFSTNYVIFVLFLLFSEKLSPSARWCFMLLKLAIYMRLNWVWIPLATDRYIQIWLIAQLLISIELSPVGWIKCHKNLYLPLIQWPFKLKYNLKMIKEEREKMKAILMRYKYLEKLCSHCLRCALCSIYTIIFIETFVWQHI